MKDYKEYIDRLHKNLCYTRDPETRHSGCLEKFIGKYGKPFLVQSDNGTEFTNKYVAENNPKRKGRLASGNLSLNSKA